MEIPFPYATDNDAPTRGDIISLLIAANIITFFLEVRSSDPFALAFVPNHPVWYTWITSAFLHAGISHLGGNMYALWIFGVDIAGFLDLWFFPFFLCGAIFGSLGQLIVSFGSNEPCLGASGAVAAVIGMYFVLYPRSRLRCMEFFRGWTIFAAERYTISAVLFGILLFVAQLYGILSEQQSGKNLGVGFGAHLGGLAFGIVVGFLMRDKLQAVPEPSTDSAVSDIESDRQESATNDYIQGLQENPDFTLPAKDQLRLARALIDCGLPVLAKISLLNYLRKYPVTSDVSLVYSLLGSIELEKFRNIDAAKNYFSKSLECVDKDNKAQDMAKSGLDRCQAIIVRVRLPEPVNAPLPELQEEVAVSPKGLSFLKGEVESGFEWSEWLLISAVEVPLGASKKKASEAGLFDVDIDQINVYTQNEYGLPQLNEELSYLKPIEYEKVRQPLYILEAVSKDPFRRLRWTSEQDLVNNPEYCREFFEILRNIAINAPSASLGEGVECAFLNKLPDSCRFPDLAAVDRYMGEEIRKALFKESILSLNL